MKYEYSYLKTATSEIEVENPAQCCILTQDVIGQYYLLCIQTVLGQTKVVEYGPFIPNTTMIPPYINLTYKEFECKMAKIDKLISKFLEKDNLQMDGAVEISLDEAKKLIKNPIDYFVEEDNG